MLAGQGYKRFENPEDKGPDEKKIPPGQPVIVLDGQAAINLVQPRPEELAKRRRRQIKAWRFLRVAAAVGLLLACSLVILESFIDILIAHDEDEDNFGVCGLGTGIWTGVLGIIAGILGVCAFRTIDSKKSILVAHFVLLIISSVSDGILIIITAFCVDALPYVRAYHEWDHANRDLVLVTRAPGIIPLDKLLYGVGALLLLTAFIHMLTSIISTAIMCRNYWCSEEPPTSVIYWQQASPESTASPIAAAAGVNGITAQSDKFPDEIRATPASYDNSGTEPGEIAVKNF